MATYRVGGQKSKWWWPAPWVFVAVGTIVIITSTAFSGVILRRVDESLAQSERRIAQLEEQISAIFSFKAEAEQSRNAAMLLALGSERLESAEFDQLNRMLLKSMRLKVIQGLEAIENSAGPYASGAPFDDIYRQIAEQRDAIESGDRDAITRMLELSEVGTAIVTRHLVDLVNERRELRAELRQLEGDKEFARTISLGLQILGVLLFMFKDVPDPATLLKVRRSYVRPQEAGED